MVEQRYDTWLQTYTGGAFSLLDPKVDDVCLEDIAHALGMLCRYCGHTDYFYSVAEHCVYMSRMVSQEAAPYALIHDAAEAYVSDLPSPVKRMVPGYKVIENRISAVVLEAFALSAPSEKIRNEVHTADGRMLTTERRDLMKEPPQSREADDVFSPYEEHINAWSPAKAKQMFLLRALDLEVGRYR